MQQRQVTRKYFSSEPQRLNRCAWISSELHPFWQDYSRWWNSEFICIGCTDNLQVNKCSLMSSHSLSLVACWNYEITVLDRFFTFSWTFMTLYRADVGFFDTRVILFLCFAYFPPILCLTIHCVCWLCHAIHSLTYIPDRINNSRGCPIFVTLSLQCYPGRTCRRISSSGQVLSSVWKLTSLEIRENESSGFLMNRITEMVVLCRRFYSVPDVISA